MKYRLLVVDDNKMMRHFLLHLFGKKNEVVAVESAEEAISWLNSHELPDLVIADYNLEGISGFDLLERLKLGEAYQSLPVIILSGNGQSNTRIQCLQAGAADFVTKPFNPLELELKVERLARNRLPHPERNVD